MGNFAFIHSKTIFCLVDIGDVLVVSVNFGILTSLQVPSLHFVIFLPIDGPILCEKTTSSLENRSRHAARCSRYLLCTHEAITKYKITYSYNML